MSNITQLAKKIKSAKDHYYNGNAIMSDEEYDLLEDQLRVLEPNHPILKSVGAPPREEWKKVKHWITLGSLNKVNSETEFTDWWSSKEVKSSEVVVMDKLDGLSIGCQYQNGKLIIASLRGDGYEGENIFNNFVRMQNVQPKLNNNFTGTIRGEILITNQDFISLTEKENFANPRNAASGICRRLNGTDNEFLTFIPYQVEGNIDFASEVAVLSFLQDNNFNVPNWFICKTDQEVNQIRDKYLNEFREKLNYQIDGLVVAINDLKFQKSLGETANRVKGKLAYKFPKQLARTIITKIDWQLGNVSGKLTPVCYFEPVELLGSQITKASLYNFAYINELQLDEGAEVLVCKAGEVIPRVEKVITPTSTIAKYPSHCPSCNAKTTFSGDYLICPNRLQCPGQSIGKIKNYISALNILEIGDKILEKLVEAELVTTLDDLYRLSVEDLASLDRMGEKSAQNVYNAIWKVNPVPLDILLGALSIPLVGATTIRLIMDQGYSSLEDLTNLSEDTLLSIKGIGTERARSFLQGMSENYNLIYELLDLGLRIQEEEIVISEPSKLTGKVFVITGTLSKPRKEFETIIKNLGGEVKNAVSKTTDYLLIGDDVESMTTKAVNARKYGTRLLSETDFETLIS